MSWSPCNNVDNVLVEHKSAFVLAYREELTSLRDERLPLALLLEEKGTLLLEYCLTCLTGMLIFKVLDSKKNYAHRIHNFSGQPVLLPHHPHSEFFLMSRVNIPTASLNLLSLVLSLHTLVRTLSPALF